MPACSSSSTARATERGCLLASRPAECFVRRGLGNPGDVGLGPAVKYRRVLCDGHPMGGGVETLEVHVERTTVVVAQPASEQRRCVTALQRRVLPLVACRRPSRSRSPLCATTVVRSTWTSRVSTPPPIGWRSQRTRRYFTGWPKADIAGIAEVGRMKDLPLGRDVEQHPALGGAGRRVAAARGHRRPTGWRSAATSTHAWSRRLSTGGYPLLDHLRKILEGPIVCSRGSREQSW